jgi:raffinose/stachyose/melibiose transport system permease protein
MVLPALVLFLVMVIYPIGIVVVHSFSQWDGINPMIFTGLDNYRRLFDDHIFYVALKNGVLFALVLLVLQIPLATILALSVLNTGRRTRRFLRISYFVPTVLSVTVVCQLWLSAYNAENGLINQFFETLGMDYRQDWLSDSTTAIFAIAIVNMWQYMGYQFIMLFTAAHAVPGDYYEAAVLDGCSRVRAHLYITIPLLQETYKYSLIIAITGGLNAFSTMYIMTGGGPG